MINYDETNFSDDPGSTKVVVQRGQKHVDRVMDHSKCSFSVMFAGAGNGKVLPPYVVYAALHLYPTWTEGGPKGWFDSVVFEDWFFTVALPYFKGLHNDKKRIIIGDNVASHLSFRVLQSCIANNISFVLLPPNSTHLCQPLDVVYSGPLKKAWRDTLSDWKKKNKECVPKHIFPRLLKKALEKIQANSANNMKAGFKASGIHPLNKNAVLKILPSSGDESNTGETAANSSFSEQLGLC
ncbi:uncharacterized protein LOC129773632 [Toxorhynchites rutilus septentrionalis]|uniref:uncharacterized protein LOC129773632 n=1 Tax=Toxorhynchites rutilus septentrionalis TaxID=329112 RepID=UPI002479D3C4|nr:uncharacterized protein LOC129773632 [Toxorhynchites rutilus septentrionalis]